MVVARVHHCLVQQFVCMLSTHAQLVTHPVRQLMNAWGVQQPRPWDMELGVGIGWALCRLFQVPNAFIGSVIRVHVQHLSSGHCMGHGSKTKSYNLTV